MCGRRGESGELVVWLVKFAWIKACVKQALTLLAIMLNVFEAVPHQHSAMNQHTSSANIQLTR